MRDAGYLADGAFFADDLVKEAFGNSTAAPHPPGIHVLTEEQIGGAAILAPLRGVLASEGTGPKSSGFAVGRGWMSIWSGLQIRSRLPD